MNEIEFKQWFGGLLNYHKDGTVKQLNTETRYLHLEEVEDNHWLAGLIAGDNLNTFNMHFKLEGGKIKCTAEFDESKHESFPFVEEKK